jgi:hypothetical protein
VRFRFIATEKAHVPVRVLCHTLQVSRAGFYAWPARPIARRTQQDQQLGVAIQAIHTESRRCYGSPRVMPSSASGGSVWAASAWPA